MKYLSYLQQKSSNWNGHSNYNSCSSKTLQLNYHISQVKISPKKIIQQSRLTNTKFYGKKDINLTRKAHNNTPEIGTSSNFKNVISSSDYIKECPKQCFIDQNYSSTTSRFNEKITTSKLSPCFLIQREHSLSLLKRKVKGSYQRDLYFLPNHKCNPMNFTPLRYSFSQYGIIKPFFELPVNHGRHFKLV